jgi:1-deoxy-D-xylulose-5-phosphate synthase
VSAGELGLWGAGNPEMTKGVINMLERINSPRDLKKLSLDELTQLAKEIRERMVEVVSKTGGHLASSLGTVELTLALHYCLNTPSDKIIWDVGHQSYCHKIITGRNNNFHTLRQYQGISGFPCKDESEFDIFTTGHSSTAVSMALGLACARDSAPGSPRFNVTAVIGDGSLSGGLCFEGLNNAGHLKKNMLVVLNTNELSIAPNVGALSIYLNKIISLPIYNRFKNSLENYVGSRMPRGSRLLKLANKFEEGLKGLFVPGIFFEELGFRYFGPLDGHNLPVLTQTLKNILAIKGPLLLHVVTKKGRGYAPAEENPVRFHGAGKFDVKTGASLINTENRIDTYTDIFSKKITAMAGIDKKIVAVTAAMPDGTGLDKFAALYPDRFFDVGIAEGHAVCFSAGLAKNGLKPIVAVYSTFLQRAYDQIMECVALQNLPVVFALDRSGIVGEDGPTHQGIFDLAFLRHIPNLVIMAPRNSRELEAMLDFSMALNKPVVIRYPKSVAPMDSFPLSQLRLGVAQRLKDGPDYAIFALGSMVLPSLEAAALLEKEGLRGSVINARFAKPLDESLLRQVCAQTKFIFTIEEGVLEGGFGSAVVELINQPVTRIGLKSEFIAHGARNLLLEKYNLTAQGIARRVKEVINNREKACLK